MVAEHNNEDQFKKHPAKVISVKTPKSKMVQSSVLTYLLSASVVFHHSSVLHFVIVICFLPTGEQSLLQWSIISAGNRTIGAN